MLKHFLLAALLVSPAWAQAPDELEELMHFDVIKVEIGKELLPLVSARPAPLIQEMSEVRKQLDEERRFVLPGVRFRDNTALKGKEFVIFLREQEVARGEVEPQMYLAAAKQPAILKNIPGRPMEPGSGFYARWIDPKLRDKAEKAGCFVLGPEELVGWKIRRAVVEHAGQVFGRQEMLVALPELLSGAMNSDLAAQDRCLRVCQNLLEERLPPQVKAVAELVLDKGQVRSDADSLTERARATLKNWICADLAADPKSKSIVVATLNPALESKIREAASWGTDGLTIRDVAALGKELGTALSKSKGSEVLYVPDELRLAVHRLLTPEFSDWSVLGHSEVAAGYIVKKTHVL
ncbi:hypothetical protein ABS71_07850 [bacterium SCN 62-11]|nr:FHIPEP family type III secretion protein [Candidatus Eremiobacteraeota bacterium]ODT72260.1 MAG: hypothetical protein ABS71_07850 [bacterium SCN 62-11]